MIAGVRELLKAYRSGSTTPSESLLYMWAAAPYKTNP